MIQIIKKFLKSDIDNLVWGFLAGAAIAVLIWYTKDTKTAMTLGGAFIGICLNKMRGNPDEQESEPDTNPGVIK